MRSLCVSCVRLFICACLSLYGQEQIKQPAHIEPLTDDNAKPKLTLNHAIELTLAQNSGLLAAGIEVEALDLEIAQSMRFPNPELEMEVSEFAGSGERHGFGESETTLILSQPIPTAGKTRKRARIAEVKSELGDSQYQHTRNQLTVDVAKDYFRTLSIQERIQVDLELLRLSEQTYKTVSDRVEAGRVSPLEQTKARVELVRAQIKLDVTKMELSTARVRLASHWGELEPGFDQVAGNLHLPDALPVLAELKVSLASNPEYLRWSQELDLKKANFEYERALRIPDLSVRAGYQKFNDRNEQSIVFGLSVPIHLFNRNKNSIAAAARRMNASEYIVQEVEVQLHLDLQDTFQALRSSYQSALVFRDEIVPVAEQAFHASTEGYKAGKFGFLDVLDAQQTLFQTKAEFLDVMDDFFHNLTELARIAGSDYLHLWLGVDHE